MFITDIQVLLANYEKNSWRIFDSTAVKQLRKFIKENAGQSTALTHLQIFELYSIIQQSDSREDTQEALLFEKIKVKLNWTTRSSIQSDLEFFNASIILKEKDLLTEEALSTILSAMRIQDQLTKEITTCSANDFANTWIRINPVLAWGGRGRSIEPDELYASAILVKNDIIFSNHKHRSDNINSRFQKFSDVIDKNYDTGSPIDLANALVKLKNEGLLNSDDIRNDDRIAFLLRAFKEANNNYQTFTDDFTYESAADILIFLEREKPLGEIYESDKIYEISSNLFFIKLMIDKNIFTREYYDVISSACRGKFSSPIAIVGACAYLSQKGILTLENVKLLTAIENHSMCSYLASMINELHESNLLQENKDKLKNYFQNLKYKNSNPTFIVALFRMAGMFTQNIFDAICDENNESENTKDYMKSKLILSVLLGPDELQDSTIVTKENHDLLKDIPDTTSHGNIAALLRQLQKGGALNKETRQFIKEHYKECSPFFIPFMELINVAEGINRANNLNEALRHMAFFKLSVHRISVYGIICDIPPDRCDQRLLNDIFALANNQTLSDEQKVFSLRDRVNREIQRIDAGPREINDAQSIHAFSVEESVAESLEALKASYPGVDVEKNYQALVDYVEKLPDPKNKDDFSDKNGAAKRFIERLKKSGPGGILDHEDSKTHLSVKMILALVWAGIHDEKKRFCTEEEAKKNLIEQFYLIQRTYRIKNGIDDKVKETQVSCPGGTVNFLIITLDKVHADVKIASVTNEVASEKTQALSAEFIMEYIKSISDTEIKQKLLDSISSISDEDFPETNTMWSLTDEIKAYLVKDTVFQGKLKDAIDSLFLGRVTNDLLEKLHMSWEWTLFSKSPVERRFKVLVNELVKKYIDSSPEKMDLLSDMANATLATPTMWTIPNKVKNYLKNCGFEKKLRETLDSEFKGFVPTILLDRLVNSLWETPLLTDDNVKKRFYPLLIKNVSKYVKDVPDDIVKDMIWVDVFLMAKPDATAKPKVSNKYDLYLYYKNGEIFYYVEVEGKEKGQRLIKEFPLGLNLLKQFPWLNESFFTSKDDNPIKSDFIPLIKAALEITSERKHTLKKQEKEENKEEEKDDKRGDLPIEFVNYLNRDGCEFNFELETGLFAACKEELAPIELLKNLCGTWDMRIAKSAIREILIKKAQSSKVEFVSTAKILPPTSSNVSKEKVNKVTTSAPPKHEKTEEHALVIHRLIRRLTLFHESNNSMDIVLKAEAEFFQSIIDKVENDKKKFNIIKDSLLPLYDQNSELYKIISSLQPGPLNAEIIEKLSLDEGTEYQKNLKVELWTLGQKISDHDNTLREREEKFCEHYVDQEDYDKTRSVLIPWLETKDMQSSILKLGCPPADFISNENEELRKSFAVLAEKEFPWQERTKSIHEDNDKIVKETNKFNPLDKSDDKKFTDEKAINTTVNNIKSFQKNLITTLIKKYESSFKNFEKDFFSDFFTIIESNEYKLLGEEDEIPALIFEKLKEVTLTYPPLQKSSFISELEVLFYKTIDSSSLLDQLEKGDLLYGFVEPREAIIQLHRERLDNTKVENNILTIDIYNNASRGFFSRKSGGLKPDKKESPKRWKLYKKAKKFKDFLGQFEASHRAVFYYDYSMADLVSPNGTLDEYIKSRCKLGILWLLDRGKKIHFLLDGFNYEKCFTKSPQKYTYAELRFLYRKWEFLEKFHKQHKIIFYETINGKLTRVSPPWEKPEVKKFAEDYKSKIKNGKKETYNKYFNERLAGKIDGVPADKKIKIKKDDKGKEPEHVSTSQFKFSKKSMAILNEFGDAIISGSLTDEQKKNLLSKYKEESYRNEAIYLLSFFITDKELQKLNISDEVFLNKIAEKKIAENINANVVESDLEFKKIKLAEINKILRFLYDVRFDGFNELVKKHIPNLIKAPDEASLRDEVKKVYNEFYSQEKRIYVCRVEENKIIYDTVRDVKPSQLSGEKVGEYDKLPYIFAYNDDYVDDPKSVNEDEFGKWEISLPKGDPNLDKIWDDVLALIKEGKLFRAKVTPVRDEYEDQKIFVYNPSIRNIQEIKNVYKLLVEDLKVPKEYIEGYKADSDSNTKVELPRYTTYGQLNALGDIESYNDYKNMLDEVLNRIGQEHQLTPSAQTIRELINNNTNGEIDHKKFSSVVKFIKGQLNGKLEAKTPGGSFITNLGKRDEATVNLYRDILNIVSRANVNTNRVVPLEDVFLEKTLDDDEEIEKNRAPYYNSDKTREGKINEFKKKLQKLIDHSSSFNPFLMPNYYKRVALRDLLQKIDDAITTKKSVTIDDVIEDWKTKRIIKKEISFEEFKNKLLQTNEAGEKFRNLLLSSSENDVARQFFTLSDYDQSNEKNIKVLYKKIGFKLFEQVSNEDVIGVHRNIFFNDKRSGIHTATERAIKKLADEYGHLKLSAKALSISTPVNLPQQSQINKGQLLK